MDTLGPTMLSVLLGAGLAAACGLRVFLPLFIVSVLSHFDIGGMGLREGFGWLAGWPAMIALGAASIIELLSYFIPFVDHVLDVIAVPLASVAGTVAAMSTFVDLPPFLAWGMALIAGGGIAGLVSAGTAATRVASTTTTAGLGNPLLAAGESAGALLLSLLAWFLPVIAGLLVLLLLWWVLRWLLQLRRPIG